MVRADLKINTLYILLFTLTSSRIRIIIIPRWYDRNIMLEVHRGSSAGDYCCLWLDDRDRLELTSIDTTCVSGKSYCKYNITSCHIISYMFFPTKSGFLSTIFFYLFKFSYFVLIGGLFFWETPKTKVFSNITFFSK